MQFLKVFFDVIYLGFFIFIFILTLNTMYSILLHLVFEIGPNPSAKVTHTISLKKCTQPIIIFNWALHAIVLLTTIRHPLAPIYWT